MTKKVNVQIPDPDDDMDLEIENEDDGKQNLPLNINISEALGQSTGAVIQALQMEKWAPGRVLKIEIIPATIVFTVRDE